MRNSHSSYNHQRDRHECTLLMNIATRFNVDAKKSVFNPQKCIPTYATTNRSNMLDSRNNMEMDSTDPDELAALYSIEEEERLNQMISTNSNKKVPTESMEIILSSPVNTQPTATTPVRQAKTIDTLMGKFDSGYLEPICINFDEILRNFRHKGKPLIGELYDNKDELMKTVAMYINRMILGLLSLDKVGMKLGKMIDRVESLYYCSGFIDDPEDPNPKKKRKLPVFVPKFMNDFSNVDYVRSMIENRVTSGVDKLNDDFYKILSSAKQRGRRKKNAIEYSYNPVEIIAKSYIKSKKLETTKSASKKAATTATSSSSSSGSNEDNNEEELDVIEIDEPSTKSTATTKSTSTIDQYPTFQKCLEILNQSIPKSTNHGSFLESITDCNRYLENTDFPAHGFLSTINNMFCCVAHNKIRMSFDPNQRRFYCAITGEEIKNGEEVRRLLFIEREPEREKDWVDFKIVEPRIFEHEKITKSVRTYLIKMNSTLLPVTLFPKKRNFDDLHSTTCTVPSSSSPTNIKNEVVFVDHTEPSDNNNNTTPTKKRKVEFKKSRRTPKMVIHGKDYVRKIMVTLLTQLKSHTDSEKLCHNNKKYYTIENERINKMLGLINNSNFQTVFDKILLYVILSSYTEDERSLIKEGKNKEKLKYDKNRLFDDLIDFILAMDTTDISYSTLHPVVAILFKLSLQKKNPAMNRFASFTEWDPIFKEHLLFFLTITELMGVNESMINNTDNDDIPDLLEHFQFSVQ